MKYLIPFRLICFVLLLAAHNSIARESADPAPAGENCQQTFIDAQRESNIQLDEQVQGTCKGDPACQRKAVGAHNQRMAEARTARDACKDAIPKLEPMEPQMDDSVPDPPLKPIEPQFDHSKAPQPTPIPGKWVEEQKKVYTYIGQNGQRWRFPGTIRDNDGSIYNLDDTQQLKQYWVPNTRLYQARAIYRSGSRTKELNDTSSDDIMNGQRPIK